MNAQNIFFTSGIKNIKSKRSMLRKCITTPVYISGELLIQVPDPVEDRIKAIKRQLNPKKSERAFMYVFGEKVYLTIEETKQALRMGITVEREIIVIKRY